MYAVKIVVLTADDGYKKYFRGELTKKKLKGMNIERFRDECVGGDDSDEPRGASPWARTPLLDECAYDWVERTHPYPGRPWCELKDNASYHVMGYHEQSDTDLSADLKAYGGYAVNHPPSSPDLNPAEHLIRMFKITVWQLLHEIGVFRPSKEQLVQAIYEAEACMNRKAALDKQVFNIFRTMWSGADGERSGCRWARLVAEEGRAIY
jgi:hypothetical protein